MGVFLRQDIHPDTCFQVDIPLGNMRLAWRVDEDGDGEMIFKVADEQVDIGSVQKPDTGDRAVLRMKVQAVEKAVVIAEAFLNLGREIKKFDDECERLADENDDADEDDNDFDEEHNDDDDDDGLCEDCPCDHRCVDKEDSNG